MLPKSWCICMYGCEFQFNTREDSFPKKKKIFFFIFFALLIDRFSSSNLLVPGQRLCVFSRHSSRSVIVWFNRPSQSEGLPAYDSKHLLKTWLKKNKESKTNVRTKIEFFSPSELFLFFQLSVPDNCKSLSLTENYLNLLVRIPYPPKKRKYIYTENCWKENLNRRQYIFLNRNILIFFIILEWDYWSV